MPEPDLARLYRDTQQRVAGLLTGMAASALAANVPACPRWSVRDVLAHLAAVAEDAVAGRLSGPPSEEETAAQVRRYDGRPAADVLAAWAAMAPRFEEQIGTARSWPGVIDVASHEQDIRGAVASPAPGTARWSGTPRATCSAGCGRRFRCGWWWRMPSSGSGRTAGHRSA